MRLAGGLRRSILSGEGMLYVAFIALIVIFSLTSPVFLTVSNFANIGRQIALVSIIAVGMTYVIIAGEFDLSVGSAMALAGVVAALAMRNLAQHWLVGAIAGLGTGALIGTVNGVLTTRLRIPSFLITLGSLGIARGVALMITNTRPVIITNRPYFQIFGEGSILGIPVSIAWTIVVAAVGIILLHFTTFGRMVYATGGNVTAARYTGINTARIKTAALVLTGLLSGLAALVLSARSHAARPDVGAGLELDAITAVILGGTALAGGRGTIVGTLIGCLMIGILNNGLVLLGVDASLQLTIKGLIIWAAVALSRK
jgi:ribose/xylose/arabinose/galactoside ABC-type transport system permease subunit